MAKVLVKARGWKSLPSCPVSANTGMNARMMMVIEKKIGRPTRCVASRTVSSTRRAVPRVDPSLLQEAERVLGHHDGGVDEHADRDGDAGQRHQVRRDAEVAHEEERRQHGQRDRDRHDEHRPEVKEEQHVHQRDDQRLLEQRALERRHGPLDQPRPVVEGHDPDAGRKSGLQGGDLRLDPRDDVARADAEPRDHDAADGLLGALHEGRRPEGIADPDGRDLADVDGDAVLGPDDDVLKVFGALDQAQAPDHRPGAVRLDDVAATLRLLRITASTTAESGMR